MLLESNCSDTFKPTMFSMDHTFSAYSYMGQLKSFKDF